MPYFQRSKTGWKHNIKHSVPLIKSLWVYTGIFAVLLLSDGVNRDGESQ